MGKIKIIYKEDGMSNSIEHITRVFESKLPNRRVAVGRTSEGNYLFLFKILDPDRKIRVTRIKLTTEATLAMMRCLQSLTEAEGGL